MNGIVDRARRAMNGPVSGLVALMPELTSEAAALQRENARLRAIEQEYLAHRCEGVS